MRSDKKRSFTACEISGCVNTFAFGTFWMIACMIATDPVNVIFFAQSAKICVVLYSYSPPLYASHHTKQSWNILYTKHLRMFPIVYLINVTYVISISACDQSVWLAEIISLIYRWIRFIDFVIRPWCYNLQTMQISTADERVQAKCSISKGQCFIFLRLWI